LWLLLASRWRDQPERQRVTQLHDIIDQHLNEVDARAFELHLSKYRHIGGIAGGVLESKFHLALAQDRGLVRSDETNHLCKLADASGPSIDYTNTHGGDWNLWDSDRADDAEKNEIAGDFLSNVLTKERRLEVWKDTIWLH
jgi:hypothetical protein